MPGKIAREIVQTKPFSLLEEEAFLNLARSFEHMEQELAELFREQHLSSAQYNVLRILRGAGQEGLTCTEAGRRMISKDPDITRLFDRLEARGLVRRNRSEEDRRVVRAYIEEAGLEVLSRLDEPLAELHRKQFLTLTQAEIEELIRILELLRP